MDKILHALPLTPQNPTDKREFAIALQRGGILIAKSCEEKSF
jgi:hypothetical protein